MSWKQSSSVQGGFQRLPFAGSASLSVRPSPSIRMFCQKLSARLGAMKVRAILGDIENKMRTWEGKIARYCMKLCGG
jgi:hypothetical protein